MDTKGTSSAGGFRSISTKILIRTTAVALIPLIVLSTVVFIGVNRLSSRASAEVDESRQLLADESIAVTSEDQAVSIAREINLILAERIIDVTDWVRDPIITTDVFKAEQFSIENGLVGRPIDELEEEFETRVSTGVASDAREHLLEELTRKPEFREVFFTDLHGYNAAWTTRTSDFVQSDEDWWQDAWENKLSISDVEFDESAGVFSVDIAVRIDNLGTKRRLGVMKAALSISFVQDIATARSSDTVNYTVALADGQLLAETATGHDIARMMNAELDATEGAPGLEAALAATGGGSNITEEFVSGYTRTTDPEFFSEKFDGFTGFDWVVVADQQADAAFAPLRGLEGLESEIESSGSDLRGAIVVLVLLGLAAAFGMSRLLSRSIVGPIQQLTTAASNAATRELPWAVKKIDEEGATLESVGVRELELNTGDELERLANSFNSVQGTALELATEQAANRRNTSEMFVNLGRRNNSLLKRQLRFIDELERGETDPDTLESLFKLDHLATRMRRNAESLLVLAGERAPRRWSAPVSIDDTVQSALAEVEEYHRVDMTGLGQGHLLGSSVADVAHILAELIENALDFSPPDSTVTVEGAESESGYVLKVSDEGLGMTADELEEANERLSITQELSRVPSQYLGLFVVGRLAQRHDITVTLRAGVSGGTVAEIELPSSLTEAEANDAENDDQSDDANFADAEAEALAQLKEAEEALAKIEAARSKDNDSDDDEPTVHHDPADEAEADAADTDDSEDDAEDSHDSDNEADEPTVVLATDELLDEPTMRRSDDRDSDEADNRQGLDEVRSVNVGGSEFPRRRSTAEAEADADGASDDEASATAADGPSQDELEKFGFTRRGSSGNDNSPKKPAKKSGKAKAEMATVPAGDDTEDEGDVEETASANRSQWSSFQKAKKAAESDPVDDL